MLEALSSNVVKTVSDEAVVGHGIQLKPQLSTQKCRLHLKNIFTNIIEL